MRGIKRILVLIMLFVMTVSMCSCVTVSEFYKIQETIAKETLAYMKEKYCGQEFVSEFVKEQNKSTIIDCYPKGSDIETDPVRVERKMVDGKAEYKDTYFNILIHEDLEADVQDMCKDLDLTMIVMFTGSSWLYVDNQFDGTKTYADYKAWEKENQLLEDFNAYIYVDENTDCERIANEIINRIQNGGMCASIDMFFYPVGTNTEENIQNDMEGIENTMIFKITE